MEAVEEKVDNTLLGRIREQFEGTIPEHWELTTLGDAFKWRSGGTPLRTNEKFYGGDIPWLIIGDLNDGVVNEAATTITEEGLANSATRWVEKGAVLLAMYGSIGKLGIAGRRLTTNQAIAFAQPEPHDAKYLFYFLMHSRGDLSSLGKGATQKNISQAVIKAYPFPLAPLPEQRRIVSAIETQLGRLDAAVARLHAAKAKLKRYKQAVLKAAVEGNLGPIPDAQKEVTGQEILDRLLNERREKWNGRGKYKEPAEPVLDELPALPEGWAWATVEQLSTKVVDGVHKKPNYVESGVPFVTVRNLTAGPGISFESLKYITEEDHIEFIKRANPEYGDVLITKDGTLGVVRHVDTHKVFSIFVSVAMIKPVDRTMGEYLSVALSSPIVQVQMVPKGSGLQHIHLEDLRADCVPIPPMSIQRWIVEEYNSYESKIQELETTLDAQLLQSTRLRQAVLKRAFEGRLV